jgi:hypothetical protein
MSRRVICSVAFSFLGAAAIAGCGIPDPYSARQPAATSTGTSTVSVTNADPAPERGGTIPAGASAAQSHIAADASQRSPEAALERYARVFVDWSAQSVVEAQRQLAALSIGQARAQALQAAASYARDQTLAQSRVANMGHLVAITRSLTTSGQWVLVTSEQTTGSGDYSGLPPTLHVIYAGLTRTPSGWVVSEWAPQN